MGFLWIPGKPFLAVLKGAAHWQSMTMLWRTHKALCLGIRRVVLSAITWKSKPMKPIRSFACTVVLASIMSATSFTALAADVPLGGSAIEGHVVTHVLAVDAANYQVTIEGADKKPVTIQLTDQAKALHNLKVGDNVDITVVRSIAYVLDTNVGGAPGVSNESMTTRAAKDNPHPGGEAVRRVKVTSKITHIDLKKHEVTLLPPEGKVTVLKVEDPELQARMKNLKVGQTVNVIYTEVLKVKTSR
ncbi:hypothetical protein AB7M23_002996 [Pseudomonas sp. HLS-6 TE3448]